VSRLEKGPGPRGFVRGQGSLYRQVVRYALVKSATGYLSCVGAFDDSGASPGLSGVPVGRIRIGSELFRIGSLSDRHFFLYAARPQSLLVYG